jgi:glycosyltransferase involved in cell wall biosynthesis
LYRILKKFKIYVLNNKIRLLPRLAFYLGQISEPLRTLKYNLGFEDFDYPGTKKILKIINFKPDIIHCHNLHSNFFDLRFLSKISQTIPTFLTLHDCWMFTGHCVHPYECKKWKKICYKCPHPYSEKKITRDASFINQYRKKKIYLNSRLYVSSPSHWLRNMAEQSILNTCAVEFQTIPNGIDARIFKPGCKINAREQIQLSQKKKIILFAANGAVTNQTKGWKNLIDFLNHIKDITSFPETDILVLGESFKETTYGNVSIKSVKWISSKKELAKYYVAADLYLHLADAENFPLSVLEAMHCGIPVVASNVGGIPEQIVQEKTGYALNTNDKIAIFNAVHRILTEKKFHESLAAASRAHAQKYFDQNLMTKSYLTWFEKVLERSRSEND